MQYFFLKYVNINYWKNKLLFEYSLSAELETDIIDTNASKCYDTDRITKHLSIKGYSCIHRAKNLCNGCRREMVQIPFFNDINMSCKQMRQGVTRFLTNITFGGNVNTTK